MCREVSLSFGLPGSEPRTVRGGSLRGPTQNSSASSASSSSSSPSCCRSSSSAASSRHSRAPCSHVHRSPHPYEPQRSLVLAVLIHHAEERRVSEHVWKHDELNLHDPNSEGEAQKEEETPHGHTQSKPTEPAGHAAGDDLETRIAERES